MKIKLDPGAAMPTRAHEHDAGFDLYAVEGKHIPARGSAVFDTGVHMEIPKGYAGVIHPRSGLNVDAGLITHGLIDAGYTGAIKVKLYNLSDIGYWVYPRERIAQIVIQPENAK